MIELISTGTNKPRTIEIQGSQSRCYILWNLQTARRYGNVGKHEITEIPSSVLMEVVERILNSEHMLKIQILITDAEMVEEAKTGLRWMSSEDERSDLPADL